MFSVVICLTLCVCVHYSVRMWPGSEWLLHEERRLPLPAGLPEASRHSLQQLWGVCGGGGGHSLGEDLPPGLLCVRRLQVIVKKELGVWRQNIYFFQRIVWYTSVSSPLSLRQPFPAGDRVTFSGKNCLCQRCIRPVSPTPKDIRRSSSKCTLVWFTLDI